jgi:hypothetical protein
MHHDRGSEHVTQLPCGREMIGMSVRVHNEANSQSFSRGEGLISIDLLKFRIDDSGRARLGAADQIGLAAAAGYLCE